MEVNVVRFIEIVSWKNSNPVGEMHKIAYLYIFLKICREKLSFITI
jgi:hypothetical protein